jgi:hypothetical protein
VIISLLMLQAVMPDVPTSIAEKYEPFRKCLLGRSRELTRENADDRVILDEARSQCMRANLSSGSAVMFAEIKAGATKKQAIDRVAALRLATEQEALASIRAIKSNGEK